MLEKLRNKHKNKVKMSTADKIFLGIVYVFLGAFVFAVIYPLVYVLSCSFSDPKALVAGQVFFWPVNPGLQGYKAVFENPDVWSGYKNTIIYTFLATIIGTSVTMCGAFVLSRNEFPARKGMTAFFTVTMFFGGGTIPTYILMQKLHLLNSMWAIILPGSFSVWLGIVGRTFIQSSIPEELYESASLDGCDYARYFYKVILPLAKPVLAVIALNFALSHWNSYYSALLYLHDDSKYPLQIVLREILFKNSAEGMTDLKDEMNRKYLAELLKYSLIVVSSLPLVCIYPFLQKYFIKGTMVGSVKG